MFHVLTKAPCGIAARQQRCGEKNQCYKTEKTFHHSCPGKTVVQRKGCTKFMLIHTIRQDEMDYLTRETYSPERVSTLITSPI